MRQVYFLLPVLALLPIGVSGQSNQWSGYPVDEGSWVNTQAWFGWVNVAYEPWIYSQRISGWAYMEEPTPGDAGAWAFVPARTPPTQDSSLLLRLAFNSGYAIDLSSSALPVTVNGAVPGEGDFAGAFYFGGSSDHLSIPDIDYGPHFTVSFWFNASDNAGSLYRYMFSHGNVHATHSVNAYFVEASNFNEGGNDKIKTTIVDVNDDGFPLYFTQTGLADGQWRHYAVSVGDQGMSVYIDGQLVNTWEQGGDPINPQGPIIIGRRSDMDLKRSYKGYLDDIRLYNRSLSEQEIEALFDTGR